MAPDFFQKFLDWAQTGTDTTTTAGDEEEEQGVAKLNLTPALSTLLLGLWPCDCPMKHLAARLAFEAQKAAAALSSATRSRCKSGEAAAHCLGKSSFVPRQRPSDFALLLPADLGETSVQDGEMHTQCSLELSLDAIRWPWSICSQH